MARPYSTDVVAAALVHLRAGDPALAGIIERVGPFTLKVEPDRFRSLARAIVAQQISSSAARSIWKRLEDLAGPGPLRAERLLEFDAEQLRTAGISPQKAGYLHDLAAKAVDGTVRLNRIGRRSDDEVIAELTQIKGIGVWTAQMFLIFSLGRLDVLPHGDLGIRAALQRLYTLPELPNKAECERIATPWRPYASVASWYCWRSGDLP